MLLWAMLAYSMGVHAQDMGVHGPLWCLSTPALDWETKINRL